MVHSTIPVHWKVRLWLRKVRFLSDNVWSYILSKRSSLKVISFLLFLPQQGMEILETDCLRSNPGPTRHVVLYELVNLSLSLGFLIRKRGQLMDMHHGSSISPLLTFGPDNPLWWSCPVHCKMFRSIPGLYPLDASSTAFPLSYDKQISPDITSVPQGAKLPLLKTTDLGNLVLCTVLSKW